MTQQAENPRAVAGDNSKKAKVGGPISADRLKSFVERIERVEEEQKSLADDKKDIYLEAKSVGYDTKTIRRVIKRRAADSAEYEEAEQLFDTYCHALGVFA